MNKLSYKTLITILIILLIGIVGLLRIQQRPKQIFAEWFDDAWNYRQAVNISTHSVGETNVYISASINIGSTTKSQPDNGDFRFTTASGQLLDYYIVSGTGTTNVSFNINFDSLPAGAQTIYAYYGNLSASNGFKTSDFSTAASGLSLGSNTTEEVGGGPISWYKLNEGTGSTIFDSSQNNLHGNLGTGSSAPSWQNADQCIAGKCLLFDSTNDNIIVGDYSQQEFPDNTNFTISLWIYSPLTSTGTILAKKTSTAAGTSGYDIRLASTGTLDVYFSDGTDQYQLTKSSAINANTWTNITVVFDNNSTTNTDIYINGTKSNATATGTLPNVNDVGVNTQNLAIGSEADNQDFFKGKIDEVKLFPYARSSTQIKQDYTSTLANQSSSNSSVNIGGDNTNRLSNGLIGHWSLDETSSPSLDKSGVGFSGSWTNSPTSSSGRFGGSVNFNGTNQYISMGDQSLYDLQLPFSISTWINLDQLPSTKGTDGEIISKYAAAPNRQWTLAIGTDDGLYFWKSHNGTNGEYSTSYVLNSSHVGKWTHVGFTADSTGKTKLFIDGQVVDTGQLTNLTMYSGGTASLLIGARSNPANYFDGRIDEARIYNRAITPNDVKNIYNYSPPPITHLKFDEGSGATSYNSEGTDKNVTLLNGARFAPGKYGKALSLNIGSSANQYANFTSSVNTDYGFTKEAWIYPTETTQCGETRCTVIGPYFEIYSGRLEYYGDYISPNGWHYGGTVPLNKWTHVAVSYDGTTLKLYVDGTMVKSVGATDTGVHYSNNIGAYGSNSRNFRGYIDEVKIYDYARSTSQILDDMGEDASSNSPKPPIAWYKFDENKGTTTNNSGIGGTINGSLGTGASTPTWTTGKSNSGLTFDGNSDFIQVADNSNLNLTGSFSISTWIKPQALPQFTCILERGTSINSRYYIWLSYEDVLFGVNNDFSSYDANLSIGEWAHISVVHDSDKDMDYVYKNGKLVGSNTNRTTDPSTTGILRIGQPTNSTYQGAYFTNGQLDEVKIHNYAMSADNVLTEYNLSSSFNFGSSTQTIGSTTTSLDYCVPGDTSPCTPPIAEWKLDEKSGTVAYDSSGHGYDGTLTNLTQDDWVTGKYGTAVNFDNSNDRINISDNDVFSINTTNQLTVEAWFNPSDLTLTQEIVNKGSGSNYEWAIRVNGDGTLYGYVYQSGGGDYMVTPWFSGSTLQTNRWYHIAMVIDINSPYLKLYVDGVLKAQDTTSSGSYTNGTAAVRIGERADGLRDVGGTVDNVRIYNYARTPAQIAYDYNKGGPVAWWKLDECQGTVANDSSGNNYTGTVDIGPGGSQTTTGTCSIGSSAAWTNGAIGKINSSLHFDGADDEVSIDSTVVLAPTNSPFSATAWVYLDSFSVDYPTILRLRSNDTQPWFIIFSNQSGFLGMSTGNNSNFARIKTNTPPSSLTGSWHHVAVSYNGAGSSSMSNFNLYLDGQLQTNVSANMYASQTQGTSIAYNNAGNEWLGKIDDVRIYNYPLTSTQVKAVYNGGSINFR